MPDAGAPPGDDPVALRSPGMCRFFAGVMRRQMRGGFRAVRVLRPGPPEVPAGRPLVVYCNHPSWWDPAFLMVLSTAHFAGRESYGPIDAEALQRYRFMRRIGLFGLDPDDPRAAAARFLAVGRRVLGDPGRMIWMTAQGRFADPREPAALRPGLAHLMARVPGAVAVPLAIEYPFWTEKRPEALAAYGAPVPAPAADLPRPARVAAWGEALEGALGAAMQRLRGAAVARDPVAFDRVMAGRAGVGGVYGLWSRARARAAGTRYEPDHVTDPAN